MLKFARIAFALTMLTALFAATCAETSPAVIYDKEIKLAEHMSTVVTDNKTDCVSMGDRLTMLVHNNAALLEEARKLTPEQRQHEATKYQARLTVLREKMSDGLIRCRGNTKVNAAIASGPPSPRLVAGNSASSSRIASGSPCGYDLEPGREAATAVSVLVAR